MRIRMWKMSGVLVSLLGLPGLGIAQVDDAPSLAGVIDIHAHVAPETSLLNFKRAFDAIEAAQIARIYGMRGIVLKEHNTEIRRVLIQGIGYDRICQELEVTELDYWQEYTLLSIDFADDFDEEGNAKPVYLLKMACPSTGFIHALRVPPDVRSSSRASLTAKEAIRWVNWDIDSEEFSVQT